MSDITTLLAEQYSESEDFRYEVYQNEEGLFDLILFQYDTRLNGYFMVNEDRHTLKTLEEATALGADLLTQKG